MESFEDICRTCLQSDSSATFSDIFANSDIALKLKLIAGITILASTDYPALICSACLKELYKCIFFRRKCQSAAEYFKTRTANVGLKPWSLLETKLESKLESEETLDFENIKLESFESDASKDEVEYESSDDQQKEGILVSNHHEAADYLDDELDDPADEIILQQPTVTTKRGKEKKDSSSQCRYCGVVLSRRNRRIEHERLHQQRLQLLEETRQFYECFLCGKQLNQKCGLVPHFQKMHGFKSGPKERWKCAICVHKLLPPGNMALHYEKVHSNFPFSVALCSDSLKKPHKKTLSMITAEVKSSSAVKRQKKPKVAANFWPCSICGNSFSNYSRYQKHLKEIHEVKQHQITEDATEIKSFVVAEKKDDPPKFPCTTCGKVFASIMTVRAHEKTHLNIEYLCDLCGSKFRVKAYLTAHVQKVHLKLKKFKCSIENCSASFVHRELLNYHVRKHLNIRNYSCRYCLKTFVTRSCCKIHERIHTDDRPYGCKFCNRTFIHHSDYRRHELKHAR